MSTALRHVNHERRKLILSLATNFITRVPGAVGVLWFLPLLRFGMGTEEYVQLLASGALGTAAAFLCGGFSLVGRRLVGEAYSNGDRTGEADGFVSVVVANSVALFLALLIVGTYCWARGSSAAFVIVSTLPVFGMFLHTFDNVRAAYNEHYITATLLIIIQSTAYLIGFLEPETRHSLVLGALVLQGPYLLSSVITLVLLLHSRPYLCSGRRVDVRVVARQGTRLAMADGFLMATLSLSVVWLENTAGGVTSAWFGTIVRLFQIFLVPVVLLLIPMSSYVRILWNDKSLVQQQALVKITLVLGVTYGAIVAFALLAASWLYVDLLLQLPTPGKMSQVLPTFLLFGAVVAYRSYSSIAYLVLEPVHLSTWTTIGVCTAVALGAIASLVVAPLSAVNIYALAAGLSILVVLLWSVARFIGPSSRYFPA